MTSIKFFKYIFTEGERDISLLSLFFFFFLNLCKLLSFIISFSRVRETLFHWVHSMQACWIALLYSCLWDTNGLLCCFILQLNPSIYLALLLKQNIDGVTYSLEKLHAFICLMDGKKKINWVYLWVFRAWIVIQLQSSDLSRFYYLAEKLYKKKKKKR